MRASLAKKKCSPHYFRDSCPLRLTLPRSQLTHTQLTMSRRAMLTHSEDPGKHNLTWGGGWRLSLTPTSTEASPKMLQMCNTADFVFVRLVVGTNQGGVRVTVPGGFQWKSRCGSEGHGLVSIVTIDWWLD